MLMTAIKAKHVEEGLQRLSLKGIRTCCRTPLLASVVSNFVNLGLDLFLMFVLGWGVAGAGKTLSSTFMSEWLSCMLPSKHYVRA